MAAAAVPAHQVVSDGFINKVHAGLFGQRLIMAPSHALPDTPTVLANAVLRFSGEILKWSIPHLTQIERIILQYRRTAGPAECSRHPAIYLSIVILGKNLPKPDHWPSTVMNGAKSYLNDIATNLLFPNKTVTWEGISMLILLASNTMVEASRKNCGPGLMNWYYRWLIFYIIQPRNEATEYPGIANWIRQRSWNGVYQHVAHLSVQRLPAVPEGILTGRDTCVCGSTRKDACSDSRFPFFACFVCMRGWCRIEKCREVFDTFRQLGSHQLRCHKYPNKVNLNCTCGQPKTPRQDFESPYQVCGNCGRVWCRVDGCNQINESIGRFKRHKITKHPDPYVCRKCRTMKKCRKGIVDYGFCDRCGDNYWCLKGYCNKEFATMAGVADHNFNKCTWTG